MLNHNEEKVLNLLIEDPFLSQQAIAEKLNMNRSTVATIISSLTDKKKLLGKAYVVNSESEVVCVGGINIDRKYLLLEDFIAETSNPVSSSISVGGVGRNIAENLGRMNVSVTLLSVAGQDQDYEFIRQETDPYVNMQHVTLFPNEPTSSYSAILDKKGDMQFALADMSICDHMNYHWITNHINLLLQAKLIVVDLNVSKEVVQEIINLAKINHIKLVIIPVSGPKMKRLPGDLTGVEWLIINQDESEAFHNIKVKDGSDLEEITKKWLDTGLTQVLITRGSRPSFYGHRDGRRFEVQPPTSENVIDVTGAGDSNASGIIYGILHNYSPEDSIRLGMTNAYYTVQTHETVRHNLSEEQLIKENNKLHMRGK